MKGISPGSILLIIAAYFLFLMFISYRTSRKSTSEDFFIGGRNSPWYVVAFGMIGATLSGVTFISVPGIVEGQQFAYMQMVFGYLFGYLVIAFVLMPMYYKLKLTSIYTYLDDRFGVTSYKTGAAYFLVSRAIQAAFRLFLVAIVLQQFLMDSLGVPFWITIVLTIALIWIYTFQGGIKTIVYTDTIQTLSMLIAVLASIYVISNDLGLSLSDLGPAIRNADFGKIWFFEGGWSEPLNFYKQFLAGVFLAIVMTGLDQDMMQKNLSCRNIGDAQKNMISFSTILIFANLLFLTLGALLFIYASHNGIEIPTRLVGEEVRQANDLLYPTIALEHLSPIIGVVFLIGLIAAAYSSADSALTALTTSFCIDFLNFEKSDATESSKKKTRTKVHVGFSVVLFLIIMIFWYINDNSVINAIFDIAGYTYGPLLGLFAFGFFTRWRIRDPLALVVCLASPFFTYLIVTNSEQWLGGYQFGFEKLILNGMLTFLGLMLIIKRGEKAADQLTYLK